MSDTIQTANTSFGKRLFASEYLLRDNILRVIGFVADIIAIGSLIWQIISYNTASTHISAPIYKMFLWLVILIWLIAGYTYICYLHSYWEKTRKSEKWAHRFAAFVVGDLVVRFRKPVLIFPAVILFAIILTTLVVTVGITSTLAIIGIATFVCLFERIFLMIIADVDLYDIFIRSKKPADISMPYLGILGKSEVDDRWEQLKELIKTKLTDNDYLVDYYFRELDIVYDFDRAKIHYAFARFALENPDLAYYGVVTEKEDTDGENAALLLVNLQKIDIDKYILG